MFARERGRLVRTTRTRRGLMMVQYGATRMGYIWEPAARRSMDASKVAWKRRRIAKVQFDYVLKKSGPSVASCRWQHNNGRGSSFRLVLPALSL